VLTISRDIRHAIRLLFKTPVFTGVAVLVLALGIGANTAVFTIVNAMLLRPIPSDGPGIVGVYSRDVSRPDQYQAFSWSAYETARGAGEVFDSVMAQTMTMVGIGEGDRTRRSFVGVISANYFSTLGVHLAAGRAFTPEEERPGADVPVVIASHQYARRNYTNATAAVGQIVRINARDYTIVGIAPEGFSGTMALLSPELWLPTGMYSSVSDEMFTGDRPGNLADPSLHALMLAGRLRPGLTIETAAPQLAVVSRRMQDAAPADDKDQELTIARLPRMAISTNPSTDSGTATLGALLMGMAGLVLLVACLNLANMLLARGTLRRKEIALRLALGSGRTRVVTQLLVEALLIAIAGGAAGLLLAFWGTRLLTATSAAVLPLVVSIDTAPDVRVLAATFGFCVLSTLVAGLVPAWRVTRQDILPDLKEQASELGAGRRFSLRNMLVVGQVALSLALLVAAGLFMRGAVKAAVADPGFPLQGGLVAGLDPGLGGYDETRGRAAFTAILQRVRSTPGVASASFASLLPFGEFNDAPLVQKAGTPPAPEGQRETGVDGTLTIVGTDYFDTLRVPILRGRGFTPAEEVSADAAQVAIIDDPMARRLFGDENPIGQRIQLQRERTRHLEVVGVVAGVRHDLFDKAPEPHVYLPSGPRYRGSMYLHVRAADGMSAAALLTTLRESIRAVDPDVPVVNMRTLEQHRDASISLWAVNTGARMFSVFGGVALLLAVVGVYGLRSYLVSRRTREIGIRIALGATRSDVMRLVLRESFTLTLVGLALGLLVAFGVARAVSGLLYDVSAVDPLVFVVSPIVLATAALAASYLPARRASRIAPLTALRTE
jgi:predicted permease